MPRLSTGLVFAGAYADKVRRTLFAQMREYVKKDREWGKKIAYAAAQLNRLLYILLVENLNVEKSDVVRVRIEYDVDENRKEIVWRWDTLEVELYKKVPDEKVRAVVEKIAEKAQEIVATQVKYEVEKVRETFDGDVVYFIKLNGKEVGAVEVLPIDENLAVLKVGAVLEPVPAVFEKVKLELGKRKIEDVLKETLSNVLEKARHVEREEALKIVNALRARAEAKPLEEVKYEE